MLLATREGSSRAEADAAFPLTYGDPAMAPIKAALDKVARTDATVLLLGETGTGKEVAARALHAASARAGRPFVAVNCAALSESLLESELFGHEKGAFTGAHAQRRGRLELAEGGTFFLDEVGELKLDLQAKLLRVLQERRFERVGGTRTLSADVRWVAATNRNLRAMIEAGTFREDLYHRLAVFPIRLPPLRERPGDLLPLAELLLRRAAAELGRPPLRLADDARAKLHAAPLAGQHPRAQEHARARRHPGRRRGGARPSTSGSIPRPPWGRPAPSPARRPLRARGIARRDRAGRHPAGAGRDRRQPAAGGRAAGHRPAHLVREAQARTASTLSPEAVGWRGRRAAASDTIAPASSGLLPKGDPHARFGQLGVAHRRVGRGADRL